MTWTVRTDRWLRAHPAGPDALLALALAATVGVGAREIVQVSSADPWVLWSASLSAGALLVAVTFRRVATEAAFIAASLAMLVTVALPNVSVRPGALGLEDTGQDMEIPLFYLPTSAVFLVLLYSVAAHRPQPRSWAALATGATGAVLCTAKTATAYGALPAGWLTLVLAVLALLAAVVGTWTAGVFQFQRRQRRVEEATEAAGRAVNEERRRIARDMHDIVAHSLAVIVRQAEGGSAIAEKSPRRATEALSTIAGTAREALTDMRGTLTLLQDGAAREPHQPTLAEIPALVERLRASGVDVHLVQEGSPDALSPGAGLAIFRLVQEALTNGVKHSGPDQHVSVVIIHTTHSSAVTVTDDGGRPQPRASVPGASVGLIGVRERVEAAGGTFEAGPFGEGFRVRAQFLVDVREPTS